MQVTPWKLDRTVNLPFLLSVVAAVIGGIVFAAKTDDRLASLERATASLPAIEAKLERIDERGEGVRRDLNRVLDNTERPRETNGVH